MEMSSTRSRCVCGRSQQLPLCDGSHQSASWSCGSLQQHAQLLIAASPSLANFAERLAERLNAQVAHRSDQQSAARLIRLCDEVNPRPMPHLRAERSVSIALGQTAEMMVSLLDDDEGLFSIEDGDASTLWLNLRTCVEQETFWSPSSRPELNQESSSETRIFLSHAVVDEPELIEAVRTLRQRYQWHVFLCGDSLKPGQRWRDQLHDELLGSTHFVIALSASLLSSTFCAFEAGYALGRGIPMSMISLDGSPPPTYLSHIHCLNLHQLRSLKPWYQPTESLVSSLIEAVTHARPDAR